MRREKQCQNCAAFYANWTEEIEEEMEEAAPGEECTLGMNPDEEKKCPCWVGAEED